MLFVIIKNQMSKRIIAICTTSWMNRTFSVDLFTAAIAEKNEL